MKVLSFNRSAFDVVNIVAGLALLLSPWIFGFAPEAAAAWSAWIAGAVIALVAAGALFAFHQAEEWVNLIAGLWCIIAPWAVGFAPVTAAVAAHIIVGVVVIAGAAGGLWMANNRPWSTA